MDTMDYPTKTTRLFVGQSRAYALKQKHYFGQNMSYLN